MPNYCLTVCYDGTDYVGWQRQANGPSIQAALEGALATLLGHPVSLRGAGRTDAGVHASGQVVSFRSDRVLPERALVFGTNHHLPASIAVQTAAVVGDDFDARFSASGKLYRYRLWNRPAPSPLYARNHWHVGRPIDVARMQDAASLLIGRHDFRAFRAADCERKTTVRLVRRVSVVRPPSEGDSIVHIEVEATAFLKQMVRILTGTLVEVGKQRMSSDQVGALLMSGDRTKAGPTAPPHGLELCRVDYQPRTGY
jgi:tRNA pseudouridine38-40 synthase